MGFEPLVVRMCLVPDSLMLSTFVKVIFAPFPVVNLVIFKETSIMFSRFNGYAVGLQLTWWFRRGLGRI